MIKFEVNQQAGKKIPEKQWSASLRKLEKVLKIKSTPEVSIAVVGETAMRRLNRIYRGKDKVTDVLSFSEQDTKKKTSRPKGYLGEIILCYSKIAQQSKKKKKPFSSELETLFIHGMMHLLGYDHKTEKQAEQMEKIEDKILNLK